HAILDVARGLLQATDLAAHQLADRQARRVIGGAVDPQAGAEALHRLRHLGRGLDEAVVRDQRLDVVVDSKGHPVLISFPWGTSRLGTGRGPRRLPPRSPLSRTARSPPGTRE